MSEVQLSVSDVQWRGYSFMDSNFRTFFHDGSFYRAALPTAAPWVTASSCAHFLCALSEEGFIPETKPCALRMDGFGKIYRQHTEFFNVPFNYANPLLLKDAALLYIRMCKWLTRRNFGLIDGHCCNFVVQGPNMPLWCDIGSILPLTSHNTFCGIDEFIRYFVYPLLLRGKDFSLADMMRWAAVHSIDHRTAAILGLLDDKLNLPTDRAGVLDFLEEFIQGIDFGWEKTLWSDYHLSMMDEDSTDDTILPYSPNRRALVTRLLKLLKPKTVVDLGANAGVFSRLAAKLGAEVLGIEQDETAVARGQLFLRESGITSPIKFMVTGVDSELKQPGDIALALALTHHLFLTHHHPWKLIANYLSAHTRQHLITEFMPNGLGGLKMQPDLPPQYTLEHFTEQLQHHFTSVEVLQCHIPEGCASRILILCTDKRDVPVDDGRNALP